MLCPLTLALPPLTLPRPGSFQYGDVLIYLILDIVPLSLFDLLVLRGVNKLARDNVDRRIFKRVTLQTFTAGKDWFAFPVVTGTGERLPLATLTPCPDTTVAFAEYVSKYTTVLDLENVHRVVVKRLEKEIAKSNAISPSKLQILRLRSDTDGRHTYALSRSLGARTMVVFPSFNPFFGRKAKGYAVDVLPAVERLVQHISFAVDWRCAVLFHYNPAAYNLALKNEVWIMTHAEIKIHFNHFRLWDWRITDWKLAHYEEFLDQIAVRLKAGVYLTIVGLELVNHEEVLLMYDVSPKEVAADLRDRLWNRVTKTELRKLHIKTWEEYTATLSPEQLEIEALPPGVSLWAKSGLTEQYLERWRTLEANTYPGGAHSISTPSHSTTESGDDD